MPVTQITLLQGYDDETQARLIGRVSDAVRSVIPATEAGTTTYVQTVSSYRRDARVLHAGGGNAALPDAQAVVQAYLSAMQARDLDGAQKHLASGFTMIFPGGHVMTRLTDLLPWARARYQHVQKHDLAWEQSWQGDVSVVYCRGRLTGVWPDGRHFDGVRFIDRFELIQGLIHRQEVWNDLAECASL